MNTIFISGSVAYDEIMDFPHHFKDYFHPEKLHQINVSFAVDSLAKHLGGCATNIAYSLHHALVYYSKTENIKGDTSTIYPVAAVGKDGNELMDFFKANSIDTSFMQQDAKLYTATGKVITDKNDNQIWGFYYGAANFSPKLKAESSKLTDFWILSATHERPFTAVLRHVIKHKLQYLFDPGMTLTWIRDDLLKKGVLNAKYVVGNDYERAMIEKRLKMTVKEIGAQGVNVITTLGEKGVMLNFATDSAAALLPANAPSKSESARMSGKPLRPRHLSQNAICKESFFKAIKLKKVVDPTGAGDAWRGGFVGALVSGKSIEDCLIMGNVMASFAVESVGTVEYKVTKEEIEKRIASIMK